MYVIRDEAFPYRLSGEDGPLDLTRKAFGCISPEIYGCFCDDDRDWIRSIAAISMPLRTVGVMGLMAPIRSQRAVNRQLRLHISDTEPCWLVYVPGRQVVFGAQMSGSACDPVIVIDRGPQTGIITLMEFVSRPNADTVRQVLRELPTARAEVTADDAGNAIALVREVKGRLAAP